MNAVFSTVSARLVRHCGASGQPRAIAVTPGLSDGRFTEVASELLKPGMRVITGQSATAQGGQARAAP